jgi:hypothetical protein
VADWPYLYVWLAVTGALLLGYLGLFLARKEVAVRPRGLIVLLAVCVMLEPPIMWVWKTPAWKTPEGVAFAPTAGALLMFALLLAGLSLCFGGWSFRLVHAGAAAVLAEMDEACRRLFIQKDDSYPARPKLAAKGKTLTLSVLPLGSRFCLILLPRAAAPGKLTLFLGWLSKRYPGPIPKIRVNLDRR